MSDKDKKKTEGGEKDANNSIFVFFFHPIFLSACQYPGVPSFRFPYIFFFVASRQFSGSCSCSPIYETCQWAKTNVAHIIHSQVA